MKPQLEEKILETSNSNKISEAVMEWEIIETKEDEFQEGVCVCGKKNLRWMNKLRNIHNGNELFPIGSECVNEFGNSCLNERMKTLQDIWLIKNGRKTVWEFNLGLDCLRYLYDTGVLSESEWGFLSSTFHKRVFTSNQITWKIHIMSKIQKVICPPKPVKTNGSHPYTQWKSYLNLHQALKHETRDYDLAIKYIGQFVWGLWNRTHMTEDEIKVLTDRFFVDSENKVAFHYAVQTKISELKLTENAK